MTKDEKINTFIEALIDAGIDVDLTYGEEKKWVYGKDHYLSHEEIVEPGIVVLKEKWEIGGVEGGNCWERGGNRLYNTNISDPGFPILDQVLETFAPQLLYSQYKELLKVVYLIDERDVEYYGNYTNYKIRYIEVEDLYDFLDKNGLIK